MRKMIFLLLMLFLGALANLTAQTRIGATSDPHVSAVLDLNASDAAMTGNQGLALPRVAILNALNAAPVTNPARGLVVFNTKSDIANGNGIGVYVWDGSKWQMLKGTTNDCVSRPEITAIQTNGNTICSGKSATLSLAAASGGSGTITYQWEESATGATWTKASGTSTGVNYTTPSLTSNMYYHFFPGRFG
jgi:hypothetical protein